MRGFCPQAGGAVRWTAESHHPDVFVFDPGGEKPRTGPQQNQRHEGQDMPAPAQAAVLPPKHNSDGDRCHGCHRFREQGQDEESCGDQIGASAPVFVELQVQERGGEHEDGGKGVLLFADPGCGFHAHRVQCEKESCEPCSWQTETSGEGMDEEGRCAVKHDVDDMVAQGGIAPEMPFQPEGAVKDGIILLGGLEIRPDAPKAPE